MSKKVKEGDEALVAIIGDSDTVTGFLLSGIGNIGSKGDANFLIVDDKTTSAIVEHHFKEMTTNKNVSIILITQKVAEDHLRHLLANYDKVLPSILEIPSKDEKYDASKDFILKRVKMFFGERDN